MIISLLAEHIDEPELYAEILEYVVGYLVEALSDLEDGRADIEAKSASTGS